MQIALTSPLILLLWGMCAAQSDRASMVSTSTPAAPSSVVINNQDFNSQNLLAPEYRSNAPSFSFLTPDRFSMHQSYSLSYASGSAGSLSSGVYLNTLTYRLAAPLTLSMDMGFYTPIYSTVPGMNNTLMSQGAGSSLIFPRVGLQYKPNDHFSLNLDFVKTQDAWKAYGAPYAEPFWSRFP